MSVLVAALAPRLLRVAGERTDGTILWMGNARAVETHVAPRLAAASAAGRPAPRIVAGLPWRCTTTSTRPATAAAMFGGYGELPNYPALLDIGGVAGPGGCGHRG